MRVYWLGLMKSYCKHLCWEYFGRSPRLVTLKLLKIHSGFSYSDCEKPWFLNIFLMIFSSAHLWSRPYLQLLPHQCLKQPLVSSSECPSLIILALCMWRCLLWRFHSLKHIFDDILGTTTTTPHFAKAGIKLLMSSESVMLYCLCMWKL